MRKENKNQGLTRDGLLQLTTPYMAMAPLEIFFFFLKWYINIYDLKNVGTTINT